MTRNVIVLGGERQCWGYFELVLKNYLARFLWILCFFHGILFFPLWSCFDFFGVILRDDEANPLMSIFLVEGHFVNAFPGGWGVDDLPHGINRWSIAVPLWEGQGFVKLWRVA